MSKFESTDTMKSSGKTPPKQSFKSAGANVKESRLNAGGDQNWRGSRGGKGKSGKGKMPY